MKRLLVALLMTTLIFSGCSGANQKDKDNKGVKVSSTPAPVALTIDESKLNNDYIIEEVIEDNTREDLESIIKYPKVSNMADSELEGRVNKAISEKIQRYKEVADSIALMADGISGDDMSKQVLNVSYEVIFRSKYTLSIKLILENYIIGLEEPDEIFDAINFNLRNGLQYDLKDLLKDTKKLNPILTNKVQQSGVALLKDINSIENINGFYIKDSGLILYAQTIPYTTADIGPLEFEIAYDEIQDNVKDPKVWEKEPASTSMNEYNKIINEETRPLEALSFIEEKIDTVKRDEATTMILSFEEIQSRYLGIYEEKLASEDVQKELINTFGYIFDQKKIDNIKDEEVKRLVKEILDGGYSIIYEESSYTLIQNYQVLERYNHLLQEEIKDYISYKAAETKRMMDLLDGYITSWDELAQSIISIENYIGKYPNPIKESDMASDYQFYFHAYLFGFNNKPAFSYETNKIDNDLLTSYRKFVEDNKKSETAMILKQYLQIIEKNNNMLCEEVENYRKTITADPQMY
ncbi:MAG: DUF4163 domain-containing protein [Clostridiaceae bacterium]|jgi:hypothetical protein|nr:DUF4163 domain-containing protein [Clostridiaceae bacterium]